MNMRDIKIVPEEMSLLNSLGMIQDLETQKWTEGGTDDTRNLRYMHFKYGGVHHRIWTDDLSGEMVEHLVDSGINWEESTALTDFIEKYKDEYTFSAMYTESNQRLDIYITPRHKPDWYHTPRKLDGLVYGHMLCPIHDISRHEYKRIMKRYVKTLETDGRIFTRKHHHDHYTDIAPKKYYSLLRKIALAFLVS